MIQKWKCCVPHLQPNTIYTVHHLPGQVVLIRNGGNKAEICSCSCNFLRNKGYFGANFTGSATCPPVYRLVQVGRSCGSMELGAMLHLQGHKAARGAGSQLVPKELQMP